jgi:hypothetical protein
MTNPPQPSDAAPHGTGISGVAAARRRPLTVVNGAFILATVAAGLAVVALLRSSSSSTSARPSSTAPASVSAPSAVQIAAARKNACDRWRAVAIAVNAARKPFIDSPAERENPVTASSLALAEAANAVEVSWLRQHLPASTPEDVAVPIKQYLEAIVDVAAADAQPGADMDANAAATRSTTAAGKIKAACGM